MSDTQEQRPAAHALARASEIVSQLQLFDLVEIDFKLEVSGVGVDGFDRIEREIGTEQARGQGR